MTFYATGGKKKDAAGNKLTTKEKEDFKKGPRAPGVSAIKRGKGGKTTVKREDGTKTVSRTKKNGATIRKEKDASGKTTSITRSKIKKNGKSQSVTKSGGSRTLSRGSMGGPSKTVTTKKNGAKVVRKTNKAGKTTVTRTTKSGATRTRTVGGKKKLNKPQ